MHTITPSIPHLPTRLAVDLHLSQGERREMALGDLILGRVACGVLVLNTSHDAWDEHTSLASTGDWLGAEWHGVPAVRVEVSALVATSITWQPWEPAHATRLLTQSLNQQKQRASDLLALRSGSAEQRCRHLLKLLSDAAPSTAGGMPGPLPALKEMARLMDLAPETTCRTLARVRSQQPPVAIQPRWTPFRHLALTA